MIMKSIEAEGTEQCPPSHGVYPLSLCHPVSCITLHVNPTYRTGASDQCNKFNEEQLLLLQSTSIKLLMVAIHLTKQLSVSNSNKASQVNLTSLDSVILNDKMKSWLGRHVLSGCPPLRQSYQDNQQTYTASLTLQPTLTLTGL